MSTVPHHLSDDERGMYGLPEGTTAQKCTGCGEINVHRPGSPYDEWKDHWDYCPGEPAQLADAVYGPIDQGGRYLEEEDW
ncbi:hypothetical protein OG590_40480 (plasmid) [Streptomyces goshikiensis]|uniref:hypothetical protein n=1 Tax=Streptomyces goshikiensis TaxID=1942 RepID=UPI002F90D268|nr:hypothetical protein OG590_40480 [Streptomyces goshikiensis]